MKKANSLIHETSPYLLQHAYNPVNWVPWSDHALELAQQENKLIIVSIGYSSCHWCHVMEHESFEDDEVAQFMNEHFITVKVDREERPDVDQIYMAAVQLMTQRGGWPLNCILLPDGRPIYGGTYFPKEQWLHVLNSIVHTYSTELEKVLEYAQNLHEGVIRYQLIDQLSTKTTFDLNQINHLVENWKNSFDKLHGGDHFAPKFPMPNNYLFLQQYGIQFKDEEVNKHVENTLNKMAMGGIFDQIGGGFARYSVDLLWKVPHFEKMLYDNAQLLAVYAQAYKQFKNPLFKRTVYQTFDWLIHEMQDVSNAFYSAVDADSEGEEGKFYCWSLEEYQQISGINYDFLTKLYNFEGSGHWEKGKYIPLRKLSDYELMKLYQWNQETLEYEITNLNKQLFKAREHRVKPSIDNKCLTSWNALLISGLCDAYTVFQDSRFLSTALKIIAWIEKHQLKSDYSLYRSFKNGKSSITGFLDDYATLIQAYIKLYEVCCDDQFALQAQKLTHFVIQNFMDETSKMFYYTKQDSQLIARKMEITDNVIPSSNSIMAHNLLRLAHLFEDEEWFKLSEQQLINMIDGIEQNGSMFSNWAMLFLNTNYPYHEVIVTGKEMRQRKELLMQHAITNTLFAHSSDILPIGKQKHTDTNLVYICNKTDGCLPPVSDLNVVIDLLKP